MESSTLLLPLPSTTTTRSDSGSTTTAKASTTTTTTTATTTTTTTTLGRLLSLQPPPPSSHSVSPRRMRRQHQRQQRYPMVVVEWLLLVTLTLLSLPSTTTAMPGSSSGSSSSTTPPLPQRAILTIVDYANWSYRAEIATSVGNPLMGSMVYAATMVLAPDPQDLQFCTVPEWLLLRNTTSSSSTTTTTTTTTDNNNNDTIIDNSTIEETEPPSIPVRVRDTPVAMMISLGGCPMEQKLNNALQLQQTIAPHLLYLVFYNNDPNNPNQLASIRYTPPVDTIHDSDNDKEEDVNNNNNNNEEDEDEPSLYISPYPSIAVISISTAAGSSILQRMEQLTHVTQSSPLFLSDTNWRWYLPMVLERLMDGRNHNHNNHDGGFSLEPRRSAAKSFYWFRFLLFALLIVSPCFRAGYLWWAGGGRLRWRRNAQGRIVGLLYIPPMTYWLGPGGGAAEGGAAHPSTRLTEEQVYALPELVYPGHEDVENGDDAEHLVVVDPDDTTKPSETTKDDVLLEGQESSDIVLPSGSADEAFTADATVRLGQVDEEQPSLTTTNKNKTNNNNTHEEINHDTSTSSNSPQDTHAADDTTPPTTTTTSTCCSICIEDFEQGETLRLLPKCRHAFHTDCILPWLTERQGCCPLCKTSVLGGDDNEDDENDENDNHDDDNQEGRNDGEERNGNTDNGQDESDHLSQQQQQQQQQEESVSSGVTSEVPTVQVTELSEATLGNPTILQVAEPSGVSLVDDQNNDDSSTTIVLEESMSPSEVSEEESTSLPISTTLTTNDDDDDDDQKEHDGVASLPTETSECCKEAGSNDDSSEKGEAWVSIGKGSTEETEQVTA